MTTSSDPADIPPEQVPGDARQQAIDTLKDAYVQGGMDPDGAGELATAVVDEAIRREGYK